MSTTNFTFKSKLLIENNDVVFPGAPFGLHNYKYDFLINPKTKVWRFGIRFSKTKQIDFFHPEHRYKEPEFNAFKEIDINVGERPNKEWVFQNKIDLVNYNLIPDTKGHVLHSCDTYQELQNVELSVHYDDELGNLVVEFKTTKCDAFIGLFNLERDYRYFKIYAWADEKEFELACKISISAIKNYLIDLLPVQVTMGNLIFRNGNILDPELLEETDLLILPVSSRGTVSDLIEPAISLLGMPKPERRSAGTLQVFGTDSTISKITSAYAYSVNGNISTYNIISEICDNLIKTLKEGNILIDHENIVVNMPLLGTGAGQLNPTAVVSVLNEKLNMADLRSRFVISIENRNIFQQIRKKFIGRMLVNELERPFSKPYKITEIEYLLNIRLDITAFKINLNGEITSLNLSRTRVNNISFLHDLKELEHLSLKDCFIENYEVLYNLESLHSLDLSGNKINDYGFLGQLKFLRHLDLSSNGLSHIKFLPKFKYLKNLILSDNKLNDLFQLTQYSTTLQALYLESNLISDLTPLTTLTKLQTLFLADNSVVDITPIRSLRNLTLLDISNNLISDVSALKELTKLKSLKAHANPFTIDTNVILSGEENHLQTIQNFISRLSESNRHILILPAKVLLLGNHESGKSSLLEFLLTDSLKGSVKGTHIVRIEKYPKGSAGIPDAIFFDFGGQDYYHGIYRAFLGGDAIYLFVWDMDRDYNKTRPDFDGLPTQDFSLKYWLSQKSYFEAQKEKADPILIIQSHADKSKRRANPTAPHIISNEFFITLERETAKTDKASRQYQLNQHALKYLKASIVDLIENNRIEKSEPKWYVDFLNYILKQNSESTFKAKNVIKEVLPHYKRGGVDALTFLKDDLDQLHKHGLVLYYKNDLQDIVWLNPVALVTYVHDNVLTKTIATKIPGRLPKSTFDKYDQDIVRMLCLQKVIFLHNSNEFGEEYIIPNYLTLTNSDKSDFDLYTFNFDSPLFTLKFDSFLPFGLINQLICVFGLEQDNKKFWRDQLVFTFQRKVIVLIHINLIDLEIKVFTTFKNEVNEVEKIYIIRYLFYAIIGLYWDMKLLNFDDFKKYAEGVIKKDDNVSNELLYRLLSNYDLLFESKNYRPGDLYISLDNKNFIKYGQLFEATNDSAFINSWRIDKDRSLTSSQKNVAIFPFRVFTNKTFLKMKKIFISYSKDDLKLVNKFIEHLAALRLDGKISNWYCSELVAGSSWNAEIQEHLDKSDIICFMVSPNLMKTQYIHEHEIAKAFERKKKDPTFKIVPIILDFCKWTTTNNNLGDFTALPYTAKPVTDFLNENMAWYIIQECLRIMIDQNLDPLGQDFYASKLPKDVLKIYERIVDGKVDKNAV